MSNQYHRYAEQLEKLYEDKGTIEDLGDAVEVLDKLRHDADKAVELVAARINSDREKIENQKKKLQEEQDTVKAEYGRLYRKQVTGKEVDAKKLDRLGKRLSLIPVQIQSLEAAGQELKPTKDEKEVIADLTAQWREALQEVSRLITKIRSNTALHVISFELKNDVSPDASLSYSRRIPQRLENLLPPAYSYEHLNYQLFAGDLSEFIDDGDEEQEVEDA